MTRLLLAMSLAAAVVVSAACSTTGPTPSVSVTSGPVTSGPGVGTADSGSGAPGPTTVPDGMGSSGVPDGRFPRTIGHFAGATDIEAEPTTIVVIATGQLDAVLTLGVVPTGAAYGDGADLVPQYVADAFPQYADRLASVVDIGQRQNVNLEAIARIEPDLILANSAASGEIYPTLSAIAPTVLTEGTGVNWKQDFLLSADALGRTEQAQRFLDEFAADAGALRTSLGAEVPTVSFVRFTAERARVFGIPSFAGFVAHDAGLARPPSQQFDATSQDFSEEEIASADADWIFVSAQQAAAGVTADSYTSNPLWAGLGAVTAGHVVTVDDDPWYLNAGPTAARIVLDGLAENLTS